MASTSTGAASATWISRAQNAKLEFSLNNGVVHATLYLKDSSNQFVQKYTLKEREITIERYNLNELLKGLKQVTYRMDQLDVVQKATILGSLNSRNIEIINDTTNSGHINILALP